MDLKLPKEDTSVLILRTQRRHECEYCEELATQKHGFLLENFRRNPQSSAYGRDDCSWCVDTAVYTCDKCRPKVPDGHSSSHSTWSITADNLRFAHMFLTPTEKEVKVQLVPVWAGEFTDFPDWVDTATRKLANRTGSVGQDLPAICVDKLGRRCHCGADFMRARDEDAFPVRFFWEMEVV